MIFVFACFCDILGGEVWRWGCFVAFCFSGLGVGGVVCVLFRPVRYSSHEFKHR